MAETANLQMTVKQAAKLMNVSERMVYMARAVQRLRPDLGEKLEAGEMSMNEAYTLAIGKSRPTSWNRLVRTWNSATDADRARLIRETTHG